MNPSQVARIVHEVQRTTNPSIVSWEKESDGMRRSLTSGAALLLEGRFYSDKMFEGDPVIAAIFRACKPPVFDINDEPDGEPDRKPGYSEKFVTQDDPAKRERMKPGPCETITV